MTGKHVAPKRGTAAQLRETTAMSGCAVPDCRACGYTGRHRRNNA